MEVAGVARDRGQVAHHRVPRHGAHRVRRAVPEVLTRAHAAQLIAHLSQTHARVRGRDLEAACRPRLSKGFEADHSVQIRYEDLAVVTGGEAQAGLKRVQLPSHKSAPTRTASNQGHKGKDGGGTARGTPPARRECHLCERPGAASACGARSR